MDIGLIAKFFRHRYQTQLGVWAEIKMKNILLGTQIR
jgi:hypothetical protein